MYAAIAEDAGRFGRHDGDREGDFVAKDDLTVAKINAALKILEWSKDDIEPGISGNPNQLHVALAEAFRTIYDVVCQAVGVGSGAAEGETAEEENHKEEEASVP